MRVAFDCDGTLVNLDGTLRDEVCRLLIAFLSSGGFKVIVWSGGGKDYAQSVWRRVVAKYELLDGMSDLVELVEVKAKDQVTKPELSIDDQPVSLGHFNCCFPPNRYE